VLDASVNLDPEGAVLVNAIYFKGAWKDKFDAGKTADETFRGMTRSKVCKMMTAKGVKNKFSYAETATYQVAALPYGSTGEYSAVIMLPREGTGQTLSGGHPPSQPLRKASAVEVLSMVDADWPQLPRKLSRTKGLLRLPQFKFEFQADLRPVLEARGMELAFTDDADFGAMSSSPLQIEKVIHRTFVEVNEKGTEAAAVTAVVMGKKKCARPRDEPEFQMVCNRPFLFFIRHDQSIAMVFAGIVADVA
jgi:serpin B